MNVSEKCLFPGRHVSSPIALFGVGADIKHLELEKKCLPVDIYLDGPNDVLKSAFICFGETRI